MSVKTSGLILYPQAAAIIYRLYNYIDLLNFR